jgi:spore maturation protein CgeB
MFEALACGMPLVSAPWCDTENLFTPGKDFLFAHSSTEMGSHLRMLLNDPSTAAAFTTQGRTTIERRHTCAHRVDELLAIHRELQSDTRAIAGGLSV